MKRYIPALIGLLVATVALGYGWSRETAVQLQEVTQPTPAAATPAPTGAIAPDIATTAPTATPAPTVAPTPTPAIVPPPAPSLVPLTTATPAPSPWPVGMAWLANTGEAAPLFQPYEDRDMAILAGGTGTTYCALISAAVGCYEAGRVYPAESTLTPANGRRDASAVWSLDDCNWTEDVLFADYQFDRNETTAYFNQYADDWAAAMTITEEECWGSPAQFTTAAAISAISASATAFAAAEVLHQGAYTGPTDLWDIGWADSYDELIVLFWELPNG